MTDLLFFLLTRCSRAVSGLLRRCGLTTQRTVEVLRPVHAVLRRLPLRRHVVRAQGAAFLFDVPDLIPLKLALVGAHEYDVTGFLRETLRPGDVFIDIGANIGYHTVLGAIRTRPGIVVAVEPSPRNRKALVENVRLNDLENVKVIEKAAWRASGERLTLHVRDPYNRGANSLLGEGSIECEVETLTVDDLVRELALERIDCVKIDVEGAELDVLQGMAGCLRQLRPPHILCALDHPEVENRQASREVLESEGYRVVDLVTGRSLLDGLAPLANLLFARKPA
jgi:FkbM family methyltransferase